MDTPIHDTTTPAAENLRTVPGNDQVERRTVQRRRAQDAGAGLDVSLADVGNIEQAGLLWQNLQSRSKRTFFTSWGWIGCWLKHLPDAIHPQLLVAQNRAGVAGLGLLISKRIFRRKLVPSRALFLHETGAAVQDSLTIEHNSFLAAQGCEEQVCRAFVDHLRNHHPEWDELFLPGIDADAPLARVLKSSRGDLQFRVTKDEPCYVVDLATLRNSGSDFCSTLGDRTRTHLRKSLRLYAARGPVVARPAGTVAEALEFYEQLKVLHRATWESRGLPGAFAEPWVDGFHRRLIAAQFACGEIQLLHVTAGARTIGYLYNFVQDGQVCAYQSGFQYEPDGKFKPGLVCHALAVEWNREQGAHTYDLLAGDCRYKRNLGTERGRVQWGVLQRDRVWLRLEDWLRSARNRMASSEQA